MVLLFGLLAAFLAVLQVQRELLQEQGAEEGIKRMWRHCLSRWQGQPGDSPAAVADCGTIPREQDWDMGRPSWLGGPAHPGDTLSGVARGGSSLVDAHMQLLHRVNIWAQEVAQWLPWAGPHPQGCCWTTSACFCSSCWLHQGECRAPPCQARAANPACTAPQQQGLHAASGCFWSRGELWADSISSCWSIQTNTGAGVYCSCRKAGLQGS